MEIFSVAGLVDSVNPQSRVNSTERSGSMGAKFFWTYSYPNVEVSCRPVELSGRVFFRVNFAAIPLSLFFSIVESVLMS